ncbi:MAG: TolC family protein, partial [Gammaproteobacteria bacterium]|nr:TolC family protein [Gammaproteobacteria bacterium]
LFVDCLTNERKLNLLSRLKHGIQQRYRAEQQAVSAGNLSLDSLGLDLAALQDVEQRTTTTATARNLACSSLNEMLGLKPDVALKLVPDRNPPSMPTAEVLTQALKDLPQRRPDLLALRYGYKSQDEEVWRAVLAQFPGISFGINRAQDTSDVHTTGFSVSINFPFLSGSAAAVHAAEASRDALWAQYQQRLDEAVSQVHMIDTDLGILEKEYAATRRSQADARHIYSSADSAYSRGDLSAPTYYDLTIAAVNRELATLDLLSQRQQLQIALQTLLGLPPQDLVHPIQEPSS